MSHDFINVLVIVEDVAWMSKIQALVHSCAESNVLGAYAVTLNEGLQKFRAGGVDAVLLDLGLQHGEGLSPVARLHSQAPEIPVIGLMDGDDDEVACKAIREGAQDVLVKGDVSRGALVRVLRYSIERIHSEANRFRLAAIVESSRDAIIGMSLEGLIVSWNPGAERMFGYVFEQVIGRGISMLAHPDFPDEVPVLLALLKRGEFIKDFETVRYRSDRKQVHVAASLSPIKNSTGTVIGASLIVRDIEERIAAEKEKENLLNQLQVTLAQVKTLSGLLPICASCKKIRDDQGYWTSVDVYVREHSMAEFTHGICPDCAARYRSVLPRNK